MSLRFFRTRAGAEALTLTLVPAAGAQSLATPQERNDSSVAALGTTYVVTKAQIVARGYAVLSDVLRDLPGMETVEHYFSEVGTAVGVRGFSGNNAIVLLVNGMRVNPPGDDELMLRRDVSVRGAARVEVRYGPGSLTYGQNAVSAVIDIITGTAEARRGVEAVAALGTLGTAEGWLQFATHDTAERRAFGSAGAQVNLRVVTLSWIDSTISMGYAAAQGDGVPRNRAFMLSLKLM